MKELAGQVTQADSHIKVLQFSKRKIKRELQELEAAEAEHHAQKRANTRNPPERLR